MSRIEQLLSEGFDYLNLGELEKAERAFNSVLVLDPTNDEVKYVLILIYNDLDKPEVSLELSDQLLEQDSENIELLLNKANCLNALGKFESSLELYDKIIEVDQQHIEAFFGRSVIKYKVEDYQSALDDINQCFENDEPNEVYYNQRALILMAQESFEKALEDLNKALKINKRFPEAKFNRGLVLRMLGQYKSALSDINNSFDEVTLEEESEKYHQRGIILSNREKLEKALIDFDKAIQINPSNVGAYYSRAMLYSKMDRYEEAFKDLKQADQFDEGHFKDYLLNGYADVYRKLKKYDLALDYAHQTLEFNPGFYWANATIAEIYGDQNNEEKFFFYLELAMKDGYKAKGLNEALKKKYKRNRKFKELLKKYC